MLRATVGAVLVGGIIFAGAYALNEDVSAKKDPVVYQQERPKQEVAMKAITERLIERRNSAKKKVKHRHAHKYIAPRRYKFESPDRSLDTPDRPR